MKQKIVYSDYSEVEKWIIGKRILLVCGKSFEYFKIKKYLDEKKITKFCSFSSNPTYDSVKEGTRIFKKNNCNSIIAIGGGSAIDVAKCIKLFSNMIDNKEYLEQQIIPNNIPFMVMPTTAGTGSEATRFAVIYKNGEKLSISHDSCIPDMVFFDAESLDSLPLYHKKATMLDALCHAIESFWSINSTKESKKYSLDSIKLIFDNYKGYLLSEKKAQINMIKASNIAGKAINITQTTAGHALCYKLTTLYGIAHGHAAALCVSKLWPYMIIHSENINDDRGRKYILDTFEILAKTLSCNCSLAATKKFKKLLKEMDIEYPEIKENELDLLCDSVNTDRLINNPIRLEKKDIRNIYIEIQKEYYESRKIC